MTLKELLYLFAEYNNCNGHFSNIYSNEIVPKPEKLIFAKSIFTRFYENCRSKSENFCVDCFKKLADYCKG